MTRKHYQRFAELIKQLDKKEITAEGMMRQLAALFYEDNQRFNHDRFYKACGFYTERS